MGNFFFRFLDPIKQASALIGLNGSEIGFRNCLEKWLCVFKTYDTWRIHCQLGNFLTLTLFDSSHNFSCYHFLKKKHLEMFSDFSNTQNLKKCLKIWNSAQCPNVKEFSKIRCLIYHQNELRFNSGIVTVLTR